MGRALESREKRGYKTDLAHLERLRKAALSDERLTTHAYLTVSKAVQTIKKVLQRFK